MGDIKFLNSIIPIISLCLMGSGLLLLIMSKHNFFSTITSSLRRLPKNMKKRISLVTQSQVENHRLLSYDVSRVEKDLESSQIRFRGKPLTIKSLLFLSVLAGLALCIVSWAVTSKSYYLSGNAAASFLGDMSLNAETNKQFTMNFSANMISFIIGFMMPRWYVFSKVIKVRYEYQHEAPQALHRLASSFRQSQNLEKAISNAIAKLPKHTKQLFIDGKRKWEAKRFTTYSEMIGWVAKETEYSIWDEFANYTQMQSTTGMRDLVNNTIRLAKESEQLLAAKKDEHKEMKFHMYIALTTFFLLIVVIFFLTIISPDLGMPLYNTPLGKLLISIIYIIIFAEIIIFSWLRYSI